MQQKAENIQAAHKDIPAYGERFPHTEHHFLADAILEGPTAAVRYVGTSGGS